MSIEWAITTLTKYIGKTIGKHLPIQKHIGKRFITAAIHKEGKEDKTHLFPAKLNISKAQHNKQSKSSELPYIL